MNRGPQRSIAKASALKLITSFGDQGAKAKYFAGDDGQTPIAAGVTPIAESAISPGAFDPATAFIRPSQRSAFPTPSSARPSNQSFGRHRLPSIGEATGKGEQRRRTPGPSSPVLDRDGKGHLRGPSYDYSNNNLNEAEAIGRAATASPMMMRDSHRRREPPPPSPSPASMAMLMDHQGGRTSRNGPRNRIPQGIDLQLQPIEPPNQSSDVTSPEQSVASSTRFHWPSRRRGPGSVASSVTSATSSVAKAHRARGYGHPGKTLDDYIHSMDNTAGRRATSRGRGRDSSKTRKSKSREASLDHDQRGRETSRGYTPRAGKRSPRSPVPMSPEELINLSTPKTNDARRGGDGSVIEIATDQPSTVRKLSSSQIRHASRTRANGGSRPSSRGRRTASPERIGRERSSGRNASPPSPVPMSAIPRDFSGSEEENDYMRAIEAKERFRKKNTRSSSRGFRNASPGSASHRLMSDRRPSKESAGFGEAEDAVSSLRRIKDERQLKKEAAARELEERRKSLARRPAAPPIPHPDELSPIVTRGPAFFESALPSTAFVPPRDLPTRSRTVEPGESRSMYANRQPLIGLPATPKAMRLILEPETGGVPGVPEIPVTFAQRASPTQSNASPRHSPEKSEAVARADSEQTKAPQENLLTLLPSTVYSPPVRPPISRCMSAPPEEPLAPKTFKPSQQSSSRQANDRKMSTPDVSSDLRQAGNMRTIDDMLANNTQRPTHESQGMPPPPPPPPVLKELQHLAIPPPPPPAPLSFSQKSQQPQVYGGRTAGMIEIVMDNDDQIPPPPPPPPPMTMSAPPVPVAIPVSEATVPILSPPAPPTPKSNHQRGRSSIDNSISSRISRVTDRVRSASRSRTNSSMLSRKSPELANQTSPYESIGPPVSFSARAVAQVQQQQRTQTGLQPSEMF